VQDPIAGIIVLGLSVWAAMNNMTNGEASTSKVVYQNGKTNNSDQLNTATNSKFFTPHQIPVQNLPRLSMWKVVGELY